MAGYGGYTHGKRKKTLPAEGPRLPKPVCPSCRGSGEATELLEDMPEISALVAAGFGDRSVKTRVVPCPICRGSGLQIKREA